ncbi:hypothetical protein EVAR_98771_1 [Eumeta japonica]|uniref:Uncharacterized protein n=1 Tax=Eumeta variegata TaxID=151549 RepID=A0A4C1YX85_EUMVA|nr:hypothetical protein EVAR_98771_1 [Eumeta japonica]
MPQRKLLLHLILRNSQFGDSPFRRRLVQVSGRANRDRLVATLCLLLFFTPADIYSARKTSLSRANPRFLASIRPRMGELLLITIAYGFDPGAVLDLDADESSQRNAYINTDTQSTFELFYYKTISLRLSISAPIPLATTALNRGIAIKKASRGPFNCEVVGEGPLRPHLAAPLLRYLSSPVTMPHTAFESPPENLHHFAAPINRTEFLCFDQNMRYPILSQKTGNALVTFLDMRVSMGRNDQLLSDDSCATKNGKRHFQFKKSLDFCKARVEHYLNVPLMKRAIVQVHLECGACSEECGRSERARRAFVFSKFPDSQSELGDNSNHADRLY